MKNKVLVVIATYNNPVLLKHGLESYEKFCANYDYDILICDQYSTNIKQKRLLDTLSGKYSISQFENDRVEASYNKAWEQNPDYDYYLFLHDDIAAHKDNWLGAFIDRLNSGYCENVIKNTKYQNLPIGKVGVGTMPWRNYSSILGYSVQCLFLKEIIDKTKDRTPEMFKYSDCDRVLITNQCLKSTNGFRHVGEFKDLKKCDKSFFDELCSVLDRHLHYKDLGMYPLEKYPPGEYWNKFCLTAELLNSIDPLIKGWRTISLVGDGYLEQIHGFDNPIGHEYLHHYGSPNMKEFLAKHFNTDKEEVKKRFNDKAFLIKCDKLLKTYFKENNQ